MVAAPTTISLALSPDQSQAVVQTGTGPLHLYQLKPVSLLGPTCVGSKGRLLAWLPQGPLLFAEGAQLTTRDLTGRVLRHWKAHARTIEQAAVSPDGAAVLTVSGTGTALWDVATGKARHRRNKSGSAAGGTVAVHPGGLKFFRGLGDCADFQSASDDGGTWSLSGRFNTAACAAFSPDGRWLAAGGEYGNLRLFDPERASGGGDERGAHDGPVTALVWASPSLLLSASGRTVRRWRVEQGFPRPLGNGQAPWPVAALASTSDGKALVAGAQETLAWVNTR